ncbi:hypothetical protein A2121_00690 [Candidatus Nomurabacteria bacterium GWB1_40_6]|uniref:Uncharacterized protein n=1 Tax=Candidatus Nomurabacteria bacterium GWB1_40_6 TaxID=1801727 RepID=A0A1F6TL87_9BACT|nr:MAG: hypothetical protein A2121_00690 [Candidatus Nomurabacteria bacterium GWB1_40_6]
MLFLVVLFLLKNTSILKNTVNFVRGGGEGLTYNTVAIGDLVNKDTDKDGILDWEEPLWGLDPTKIETTPGVPDSSVIKKLRAEQGFEISTTEGIVENYSENLTETEKFSREFFSTAAALSQSGVTDQETMDQIGVALAEKIQNSSPRKIFQLLDIKAINNNSAQTIETYASSLNNAYVKNPIKGNVVDILEKFIIDENNVDGSVLEELDPIIKQTQNLINEVLKINVPESLTLQHLDFLNAMERVVENISNIRLYNSDVVLALGGISQYDKNTILLESALKNLSDAISQKLNS